MKINTRIQNFELKAENTYSFETLHLDEAFFADGSIKTITGFNHDQDTDNGAGKTTIAKIIYYAITGKTLSGASVDSVTRMMAGGSAKSNGHCVELRFTINGNRIKIKRYRDWASQPTSYLFEEGEHFEKKGKNTGLRLFINDQPWDSQKGANTQDQIINLIGATPKLFLLSIFSKQGSGSEFLNATETEKSQIFSEFMDFDAYIEAHKKVAVVITEEEKKKDALLQRLKDRSEFHAAKQNAVTLTLFNRTAALKEQEAKVAAETQALNEIEQQGKALAAKSGKKVDLEESLKNIEAMNKKISDLTNKLSDAPNSEVLLEVAKTIAAFDQDIKTSEEKITQLEKSLAGIESTSKSLNGQVVSLNVADLGLKVESYKIQNPIKIDNLEETLKQKNKVTEGLYSIKEKLSSSKKDIEELIHSMSCPTCKRLWDEATLAAKNEEIEKLNSELTILNAEEIVANGNLSEINQKITSHELFVKMDALLSKLAEADLLKEKLKVIDLEINSVKSQITEAQKDLQVMKANRQESLEIKATEEARLEQLKATEKEELKKSQDELTTLNAKLEAFRKYNSELDVVEEQKAALREKYRLQKNTLSLIQAENPLADVLALLEDDIKTTGAEIENIAQSIKTIDEDLAYLEFCKEAFGPAGVRSFISDDLITVLNDRVEEYLDFLYDGALSINFSSQSTNTKGVISNKISTSITHNGLDIPIEEISGGENKRIELAVNLAIADVAEEYTGFNTGWRFMDEPFDGICQTAQLKCVNLLKKISEAKNRIFFIISHNPNLQQMVTDRVHVEKKNSISSITYSKKSPELSTKKETAS